jgi:hypothetical protein
MLWALNSRTRESRLASLRRYSGAPPRIDGGESVETAVMAMRACDTVPGFST